MEKNRHVIGTEGMIRRYYQQTVSLPSEVVRKLAESWPPQAVILYACIDLDHRYQLRESWLVLGEESIAWIWPDNKDWKVETYPRHQIKKVIEISGLSCQRLLIEGRNDEVLLSLAYSLRQAHAVSLLKFVLEQQVQNQKGVLKETLKNPDELYRETLIQPVKEAQAAVAANQMDVIWRLLTFLRPYKKQVAFGMLGAVLMTLVSLVPAFLTGYLIDQVIKPFQSGHITKEMALQMAYLTVAALVTIYLLRELFAWVRLRTMSVMGENVAKDLRDQVYTHLQKLSLSFFSSKQTGSIISRVGSDTDRIWDFIAFGVVEVTTSLIMLTGLSIVLMTLDWRLGLLVTLPVPLILWIIVLHGRQMQKLFLRAWRKWSNLTDCLSDTIPGIRVVKAFNREKSEVKRFTGRNAAVVDEFNRIHKTWTSFWPFLMLMIQGVVVSVWAFGVPRVLDHVEAYRSGEELFGGLSPGVFVSFVLYLGMYVNPIEIIGQMSRMVNRATSSAHRVFEVLDTEPQVIEVISPVELRNMKGRVEFENVVFSYDGVRKILKGVSFDIKPGEMIGLVGPSGSGKTTITNVLARFYDVSSGEVKVDGVDLRSLDLQTYRSQIGMVLQDPYLFHGSILENIRYGDPEASLEKVIEASRAANAHDFICRLTQGYDTIVGERGHTLSGGERQRISIARAILRNPKILILDEATSSVDTETERKIQEAIDRLVKGRTTIAIAHRLSTLAKADRILVLEHGRLVEQGTHRELLKTENGVYTKLVKMQIDLHKNIDC